MKGLPELRWRSRDQCCRRVLLTLGENQTDFIDGVFRYGEKVGWLVDTLSAGARLPRRWRGDGVLAQFSLSKAADRPLKAYIRSLSLPCVSLGPVPVGVQAAVASVDHPAIAQMAADHLAGLGHQSFLCVHGPDSDWTHRVRQNSFRQAIAAKGGTSSVFEWDEHSADSMSLLEKLASLLDDLPRPLAVWATVDRLAMQVLIAARVAGLSVPEDVAVLGADKNYLAERYASIPLSTIDNGQEAVGYCGAALLDRMIDGAPLPPDITVVPPKGVICRQSTDILVARCPAVVAAINYMKGHLRGKVRMDVLSKLLGFSAPTLFAAFQRDLQRTPMGILLELRLREAERQLVDSNAKIEFIAYNCGFGSKTNFSRVFKKARRISPSAWRLQNRTQPVRHFRGSDQVLS